MSEEIGMTDDQRWPTREEFRRMTPTEVNDWFASHDLDARVAWFAAHPARELETTRGEDMWEAQEARRRSRRDSGETFPAGWGCPCCDGTGFVSDEMADRLRAIDLFPPDRL